MSRKRLLKYIVCPILVVFLLIPTISNAYLIYRVDRLESRLTTLTEQGMESAGDMDSTGQDELELSSVSKGEGSLDTGDSIVTEQEMTKDIDSIENQLIWDTTQVNSEAWDSDSGMRKVYLTFDDGPSRNTDKILDILNEYGVKATFFVVGKEGFEEQYQRIVAEGHTLGMHSYSHKYREIYQSKEAYAMDLEQIQSYLYEMTGVTSRIVRFPGGSSNSVSNVDMHELTSYLDEKGITYFDWNVSSADAGKGNISASQITANVMNNVMKYDSAVVLMHDSADRNSTVEALPMIIEKILESENTVLLPISEETVPIQHIQ